MPCASSTAPSAAAGRREARDIVDLVTLHEQFLPLGASVWAAVETAPGFTPEGLIAEIRRNSRYPAEAFAEIDAVPPILSLLCERLNERRLAASRPQTSITAADFYVGPDSVATRRAWKK